MSRYTEGIQARTTFQFIKGFFPRLNGFIKFSIIAAVAKLNGAHLGRNVTILWSLALKANANLTIGDNTAVQTSAIDLRAPVRIGSNVIIGQGVEIITASHNIDSVDWEVKYYGIDIHDFSWIATKCLILPSCRVIERGAVCAAGAVVASDVPAMAVFAGNPACYLRSRKTVHSDLCVQSLRGNDFVRYVTEFLSCKNNTKD